MSAAPSVAAVVLSWNGRERTLACLRSLAEVTYRPFSIVVVDNGSGDGSADAVAAEHPDVQLVRLTENLGFAGGMNAGSRAAFAAGAEAVVLLNNDMEVEQDFVGPLVEGLAADPARRVCVRSDPVHRRAATHLVRGCIVQLPAWLQRPSRGLRQAAATRDGGAVPNRSGLRRGDDVHGARPRSGSACSTRSCSPTPRTRTGRCVRVGPGCTRSSFPPASSTMPCPPRREASRPPGRSTTHCATRSSSPSAGHRGGPLGRACGASRLLPPPRLRRSPRSAGRKVSAPCATPGAMSAAAGSDRVKRRPRASRSSAATPACGCSCTCVHRGIAWVTVMAAARSAGPRRGSCATRGFCPVSWRASPRPDSRIARVSSAPRAARAGACACSRTSCSSTTPPRRARWRASSRRSASACSTSPSSTRSAGCTRCWRRCHA